MGILMAIIVYLVIFGTPFLIGWNIIKKKRPRDVGNLVAAIVLLLFYQRILTIFANRKEDVSFCFKVWREKHS